ncbi:SPOR domain-containing protein [Sphingomicrobium aestuariivivum]|uniref:SPOR domain-containing protein n=1 Tax=Sphingomicrobium aestuariivivum TaxID=1582356 RepID=UPI002469A9FC|nr:SPOR domain-containing protein [Sphingomicrobium aestuariivivum]
MTVPIFSAFLIALAAPAAPPAPAGDVAKGIAAWQAGEHGRAIALWAPLAEAGDRDALFNLGQAYRLGRGVQRDAARAATLFERAARQGHTGARTNLGLMLYGEGRRAEGLRWLRGAADAGEPRAMLVYGTALFNGEPLTRDMVTGYALVSRAAAKDLAPARTTLAEMDKLLSVDARREGVALAQALASGERELAEVLSPPAEVAVAPSAEPRPAPKPAAPAATPAPSRKTVEAPRPATTAKPASKPAATTSGAYAVQLGAFSRGGAAQSLYDRVKDMPALAGKSPAYVEGGGVTRLRITGFASMASAERACAALEARGQACYALKP